tara:strand:- start:4938 stop:5894 length:957 start_codon:yes stop_codon:yes gene_type:complete
MTDIKLIINQDVYKDNIATPTILLFIFGGGLFITSIILRLIYNYSALVVIPLSALGTYCLFPVIHDGSHGSICKNKFYNELISYIAGVPFFFAPFPTWRFIHLRHHRYTNIPDKDPDYYAGGGVHNSFYLPIRWITHIFHYYVYFITELIKILYKNIRNKLINEDNTCEIENIYKITSDKIIKDNTFILFITGFSIFLNILIVYYTYCAGVFDELCILWIIPSTITIMLLSVLFDYLPHRYYEVDILENKYKTTNMTHGLMTKKGKVNKLIAFLTCNQLTYHNIHHLYPKVPFYLYPKIWDDNKDELIRRGTKVQAIF